MGEDLNQMFDGILPCDQDDDELRESSSSSGDSDDEDFREDSTFSPSYPPPMNKTTSLPSKFDATGTLYDSSSLTAQLPIKRGLSKYYQGKSQSFTSLSDVRCLEDLPKKETPIRRKMKSYKSYGGGLDGSLKSNQAPATSKNTRSKKASGGSCASSIASSSSKPPSIPLQRNFFLH